VYQVSRALDEKTVPPERRRSALDLETDQLRVIVMRRRSANDRSVNRVEND